MKQNIFLILLAGLFLAGCGVQSIPKSKNAVEAEWAEIQNQYQRRADLVPNLVNVVKGYAKHERETLESVTEARAKASQTQLNFNQLNADSLKKFQDAQASLTSALSRLLVVVEKYPDLKANENFRDLQVQLEGTENRIAIARRRYIEAVQYYNNQITVPPASWTNRLFYHYQKMPQFAVDEPQKVKEAPKVEF